MFPYGYFPRNCAKPCDLMYNRDMNKPPHTASPLKLGRDLKQGDYITSDAWAEGTYAIVRDRFSSGFYTVPLGCVRWQITFISGNGLASMQKSEITVCDTDVFTVL